MKRTRVAILALLARGGRAAAGRQAARGEASLHVPTMTQFMGFAFPLELVAARKADRIAWIANDKGMRNVFTAAAPDFKRRPRHLVHERRWRRHHAAVDFGRRDDGELHARARDQPRRLGREPRRGSQRRRARDLGREDDQCPACPGA